MDWLWAMQIPTPDETIAWNNTIEKLGIIFLLFVSLVVFILAIVRQWFAPWYVVVMLERRIVDLEERERKLWEIVVRGTSATEQAISALKQRR